MIHTFVKSEIRHRRRQGGFSLVATVIMMVLLVVLALSMLSLSSVSLRVVSSTGAQAVAQANARLALSLAIGRLQRSAGPDRRITARADILKSCDPGKKYWTGVWSTEGWSPQTPANRTFVSWLTSEMEASPAAGNAALAMVESPAGTGGAGSRRVNLVAGGSLGSSAAAGGVELNTVPIRSGGRQTGGYAYWVGDEGMKARYDLTEPETPSTTVASSRWAAPPRSGIQKIAGMERYLGVEPARVAGAITFPTIALAQQGPLPDGLFHDLSTDSEGLVVDVRNGGPRHDLSLAFELPAAEFNDLAEFHDAGEVNNTNWYSNLDPAYDQSEFYPSSHKLGYVFQIPIGQARLRGPTWDLLRNHSRLYKKEWEAFSWPRKQAAGGDALEARGSLPLSYSAIRDPRWSINGRWGEFSNEGMVFGKPVRVYNESVSRHQPFSATFDPRKNTLRRTAERITPIVTRVTFALGLVRGSFPYNDVSQETIAVSMDPYFTILNPYNKPIEFHSIGYYTSKFNPFTFEIRYRGTDGVVRTESFNSSHNTYNQGSFSFRLDPSTTGGRMRLEPGEMKVISPRHVAGGYRIDRMGATPLAGTKDYQEDSGIVIPPKNPIQTTAGSVTLTARGRPAGDAEADSVTFSLFLPKTHNGQNRDVVTDLPPVKDVQLNTDAIDDPLIQRIGFTTVGYPPIAKTVSSSQIPRAGEAGLYLAAFDMWMKDFDGGDRAVLAQFNPRATAIDPRDYDGTHRVSPAWNDGFFTINDISELGLVTAYGLGRWGGGSGGGGAGNTSYLCLYDIPRAPLTSLASFQHADTGSFATDAPYAIGNSFPPPTLDPATVGGTATVTSSQYTDWNGHSHMDVSWAANESLWDHYFLSGLSWGGTAGRYPSLDAAAQAMIDDEEESPFANSRVRLAARPGDIERLKKHDTIGDHLAIRGAFNINSTSVNAWKAVLAGLDQAELSHLEGTSETTGRFNIPVSRFSMPAAGPADEYRGFRSLDDAQLDALAKAIVEEVRARGPFMGLSDFVNRRLEAGDNGRGGALQTAIDRSGINSNLDHTPTASNVANQIASTEAGLPGYIMQSDLLTLIGSFISARSDTFKVRAYGEATDPNGKVTARAWCEAIIQRAPEWLETTEQPATITNPDYPATSAGANPILRPFIANPEFPERNNRMGRRFMLASFRWLSPGEV